MHSKVLGLLLIALTALQLSAQVPRRISYQGVLTTSGGVPAPDGTYGIFISLYDSAAGGNLLWNEMRDGVELSKGTFQVMLGSVTPLDLPFDKAYYVELMVYAGPGISGRTLISPRIELAASPYALRADSADHASPAGSAGGDLTGSYPNPLIANGAVTSAKIADGSVEEQDVKNGQVVKSLNGLRDYVRIEGAGGATVTTQGDSIVITAGGGGGGSGIQGVQNTNNTLDIANPNGPTATVNVKLPFSASTATGATTFQLSNLSDGAALSATSANGDGIVAASSNAAKSGIWGDNPGGGYGVAGSTGGPSTAGVWGSNSGSGLGVKGTSITGIGMYGQAAGTAASYGVVGENTASTGTGIGVYGRSGSTTGMGVYGWANNASGVNYGVYGQSGSSTGYGGYFVGRGYFSSNVGIGTTAPEAPLHVANRIRIGKDLAYPSVYGEIKHDGSNTGFVINAAAGGGWADIHFQTDGTTRMFIESGGNVGIGTTTPTAKLDVVGTAAVNVLQINGGSDMAEPFYAGGDAASREPGTLMVLDAATPGKVSVSSIPYDKKVVGIVSGAGGVKPGLTLRQEEKMDGNVLVAIAGRVYCKAVGPVEPGDLLTTSSLPGYAMSARDRDRSHGAIIGKAMSGLQQGTGLVLVLVNLQ